MVNEVAVIIVESYSNGSSQGTRDEVSILSVFENTTHRAKFRGSSVKLAIIRMQLMAHQELELLQFKYYIGSSKVLT